MLAGRRGPGADVADQLNDSAETKSKQFFISYTSADRAWAEWIACELEANSYKTIIQAWDFRPGEDFVRKMQDALRDAERVIAVVSPQYFSSDFATAEWNAAFAEDPSGRKGRLLPVRVSEGELQGLPGPRIFIDLVGLDEKAAKATLLAGISRQRARPAGPTQFPGATASPAGPAPAFPAQRPLIWRVPPRNRNFIGRDQEIELLRERTLAQSVPVVQVLHGLGGVGKSQIAKEFAHRYAADYELVWWVEANVPLSISEVLAGLASQLGVKEQPSQEKTAALVWEALSQRQRWLVIFDYAEHAKDLGDYQPTGVHGHVLITSRSPVWKGLGQALEVKEFNRDDSVAFLTRRLDLPRTGVHEAVELAGHLAEDLGDLPLALEQAGAYMEQTGMSLSDYIKLFQRRRRDLLNRGEPTAYEGRLDTTWQLAFDRVAQRSQAAVELLRLISFLAPDAIPLELLNADLDALPPALSEAVRGVLELEDAVAILNDYSLIDRDKSGLRVHRLVQLVVREDLSPEDRGAWAERVVHLLSVAFPADGYRPETWPACAPLVSHALVAAAYAQGEKVALESAARLLKSAGLYLGSHVRLESAREALERALKIAEVSFGPDHPETSDILAILGDLLRELGKLPEAEETLERALGVAERAFGNESPPVASILSSLGIVLRRQGRLSDTERALRRALAILEGAFGPKSPQISPILSELGLVLSEKGDHSAAIACLERALALDEANYGVSHHEVATPLTLLGLVLRDLGDLNGAREKLARALEIDEAAYGAMHPRVAARLNNLGTILRRQGDLSSAHEKLKRALAIDEDSYGPSHPEVATVLNNLGIVTRRLGDPITAKTYLERSLSINERSFGPDHFSVGLANLGDVQRDLGDLEGARESYQRCLSMLESSGAEFGLGDVLRRRLESVSLLTHLSRRAFSNEGQGLS